MEKYRQDGGWEPWFQSEPLTFTIQNGPGNQRYAEREQAIWNDGKKVDILTNYGINHEGFIEAIELKCASIRQDKNAVDLGRRMQDDTRKLQELNNLNRLMLADQKRFYGVSTGVTLDKTSTAAEILAAAPGAGLCNYAYRSRSKGWH